jgi:S1-C subfamily serine protease
VNGAFNHGNSGGPLLVAHNNEVIGVVVMTFHFYPKEVKDMIDSLAEQRGELMVGTIVNPDGTRKPMSEAQVTGMVLDEFYEKTQVMIGEAISGSEVTAMLKEHSSDLPHKPVQSVAGQN